MSWATRSRAWGSRVLVSSAYFCSRNALSKRCASAPLVWAARIISSVGRRLMILGQTQQSVSLALPRLARRTGSMFSMVAWMPTACKYVATASASGGISGLASWVNDQILTVDGHVHRLPHTPVVPGHLRFEFRVPRNMVLAAEIDRHPLGREARGEDLHAAFLGVTLELARQIDDVGLPIQQHGQAGRFFRGDAHLQFFERRPDAAPVVLHPLEDDGPAQLAVHI